MQKKSNWNLKKFVAFIILFSEKSYLQYVKLNRLLLKQLITKVVGLNRHRLVSKRFL